MVFVHCRTIVATFAAIGLLSGCPPEQRNGGVAKPCRFAGGVLHQSVAEALPDGEVFGATRRAAANAAVDRYESYLIPRLKRFGQISANGCGEERGGRRGAFCARRTCRMGTSALM
jgi:hypothetical protein